MSTENLSHEEQLERASAEVRGAIRAFEQILQVMPYDLASLESLWRAYSDVGDDQRALDYLFRLGDALEEQNDPETAERVLSAMTGAGYAEDPRIDRLKTLLASICKPDADDASTAAKTTQPTAPLRHQANVADELSFAWYLFQAEQLTREEYARVADVLSEMSATSNRGTLSVLHALESMHYPKMERLLEFVASNLGVPFVNVTAFDIGLEASRLLPLPFMAGRGVMPFEIMDRSHALVAVLNPHDTGLKDDIQSALERRCYFFLTSAMAFDAALKTVAERLAAAIRDA